MSEGEVEATKTTDRKSNVSRLLDLDRSQIGLCVG